MTPEQRYMFDLNGYLHLENVLMRRHDRLDMGKRRYRMTDFKWFFKNAGPRFEAGQYFGEDRERAVTNREPCCRPDDP